MTACIRAVRRAILLLTGMLLGCAGTPPEAILLTTTEPSLLQSASGERGPTWVMLAGHGALGFGFVHLAQALPVAQRWLWIDRPGLGWNRGAVLPPDAAIDAMRTSLRAQGELGPYVLIGHSLGGAFALRWAQRWPGEVVGLGLISPTHPGLWQHLPVDEQERLARYLRFSTWLPTLARTGLLHVWNPADALADGLPEAQRRWARVFARDPVHLQGMIDEARLLHPDSALLGPLQGWRPPPGLPLVWVIEEQPADAFDIARRAVVAELGVPAHTVRGADHVSLLTRAEHAQAVAQLLSQGLLHLSFPTATP